MRKLSVAIVSIGCVLSSFVARAQAPTATQPKPTATHAKVLHLSALHIVIDQPGMYVLDRNWLIPGPGVFTEFGARIIEITANDVVLDLRGFTIDTPDAEGSGIYIGGANVTLRNGKLTALLAVDGASTVIDSVVMEGLRVNGPDAIVRNSSLESGSGRGDRFLIEGNRFDCVTTCASLSGDGGVFRNNQLYRGGSQSGSGGVLSVSGSANTIENNYFESVELYPSAIFVRNGRQNVIAHNTMVMTQGLGGGAAIIVHGGSENVIDGNIANHSTPNVRWEEGVEFALGATGNFFGNNRMKADTPFAQHSGPQVDWGGNVGY